MCICTCVYLFTFVWSYAFVAAGAGASIGLLCNSLMQSWHILGGPARTRGCIFPASAAGAVAGGAGRASCSRFGGGLVSVLSSVPDWSAQCRLNSG